MSGKTMNFSFKEIDGKIQMRDLRTIEEQIAGVELSQEEIITRLSTKLVTLERLMDQTFRETENEISHLRNEIVRITPYYECYHMLQKSILESPTLMQEWQRFCLTLKLTDPDEDKYNEALGK